MADHKNLKLAQEVFQTVCTALDNRNWRYGREDEKLLVHFGVSGDDLPMKFVIVVDADRMVIRLMTSLQFNMSQSKRVEGALATCVASSHLADGCFDYDLSDGSIVFRLTAAFMDSTVGEGLIQYMISCACAVVDEYNDRFLAIDRDVLSIMDFIAKLEE